MWVSVWRVRSEEKWLFSDDARARWMRNGSGSESLFFFIASALEAFQKSHHSTISSNHNLSLKRYLCVFIVIVYPKSERCLICLKRQLKGSSRPSTNPIFHFFVVFSSSLFKWIMNNCSNFLFWHFLCCDFADSFRTSRLRMRNAWKWRHLSYVMNHTNAVCISFLNRSHFKIEPVHLRIDSNMFHGKWLQIFIRKYCWYKN